MLSVAHTHPLQCSCLGSPRDGGAWWAAIYGVAQSRTRLKRLSSSSSSSTYSQTTCGAFSIMYSLKYVGHITIYYCWHISESLRVSFRDWQHQNHLRTCQRCSLSNTIPNPHPEVCLSEILEEKSRDLCLIRSLLPWCMIITKTMIHTTQ